MRRALDAAKSTTDNKRAFDSVSQLVAADGRPDLLEFAICTDAAAPGIRHAITTRFQSATADKRELNGIQIWDGTASCILLGEEKKNIPAYRLEADDQVNERRVSVVLVVRKSR